MHPYYHLYFIFYIFHSNYSRIFLICIQLLRQSRYEQQRIVAQILAQNSKLQELLSERKRRIRDAGCFNARSPRSKEFHLQIPLHVLRTGSIVKEFLLDRGFRVRSKVRNGETANGPSGMICAQHTQELQNRRGKTLFHPSPPSIALFLAFSTSPLIRVVSIRYTGCSLIGATRRTERFCQGRQGIEKLK